ncbi:hypothetical protein WN943_008466 [Citrus x changshan-huyou]
MNRIDAAKFTHIDAAGLPPPSLAESEQRRSNTTTRSREVVTAVAVDPQLQ